MYVCMKIERNRMLLLVSLTLLSAIHLISASMVLFESKPPVIHQILTKQLQLRCSVKTTSRTARFMPTSFTSEYDSMMTSTATTGSTIATSTATGTATTTAAQVAAVPYSTSSQAEVSHVTSLIISKVNKLTGDKETVASVTPFDPPLAEGYYTGTVRVEGSCVTSSLPGELGYLQLTWDNPVSDQAGSYLCELYALNMEKHSVYLSTSIRVDATEPNIADLVKYIIVHDNVIGELKEENRRLREDLLDLRYNSTLPLYYELLGTKHDVDVLKVNVSDHTDELVKVMDVLFNTNTTVATTSKPSTPIPAS